MYCYVITFLINILFCRPVNTTYDKAGNLWSNHLGSRNIVYGHTIIGWWPRYYEGKIQTLLTNMQKIYSTVEKPLYRWSHIMRRRCFTLTTAAPNIIDLTSLQRTLIWLHRSSDKDFPDWAICNVWGSMNDSFKHDISFNGKGKKD